MTGELHEKCAVVGVMSTDGSAARTAFQAQQRLEHRGTDASGNVSFDEGTAYVIREPGSATKVFEDEARLDVLRGDLAVAHGKYTTNGDKQRHLQPVVTDVNGEPLAGGHNGNLPVVDALVAYLEGQQLPLDHPPIKSLNDSELLVHTVADRVRHGDDLDEAVAFAGNLAVGAYSLVVGYGDELVGAKDGFGIRPLELGVIRGKDESRNRRIGHILTSETCAFDAVEGDDRSVDHVRSVRPGELVIIGADGTVRSRKYAEGKPHLDLFEEIYFADQDSTLYDQTVWDTRFGLGVQIGERYSRPKDPSNTIVVSVPSTSNPAAQGLAKTWDLEYVEAIEKIANIRSFLESDQLARLSAVNSKHYAHRNLIAGHHVDLVDDSIVRLNTLPQVFALLKRAGALSVRVFIASAPVKYPDSCGIDIPNQRDLAAANFTTREMRDKIGASFLGFLSMEDMIRATGRPMDDFHRACFDGENVIPLGRLQRNIYKPVESDLAA